jgi:hypothetical protein
LGGKGRAIKRGVVREGRLKEASVCLCGYYKRCSGVKTKAVWQSRDAKKVVEMKDCRDARWMFLREKRVWVRDDGL